MTDFFAEKSPVHHEYLAALASVRALGQAPACVDRSDEAGMRLVVAGHVDLLQLALRLRALGGLPMLRVAHRRLPQVVVLDDVAHRLPRQLNRESSVRITATRRVQQFPCKSSLKSVYNSFHP